MITDENGESLKTFEVAFPIMTGFSIFTVTARTEEEAIDKAMDGRYIASHISDIETDFDSNLATVEET